MGRIFPFIDSSPAYDIEAPAAIVSKARATQQITPLGESAAEFPDNAKRVAGLCLDGRLSGG
jgi:hypothetical protein